MIFLLLFALFLIVSILVIQTRKNGKLSFLDIEVSREKGKFVTNAYKKATFCCMYTHFENFLPTVYKFGMVYTYLSLFQYLFCLEKVSWRTVFWNKFFLKNGYLLFIDNCFKTFDDQMFIKHPQLTTVEKKTLFLSLPSLETFP